MTEKLKRLEKGEWFEWPNIVALNWFAATLVGDAKRIIEVGCGTGCFAYEAAADPRRSILAADIDDEAIRWATEHRKRPNIEYASRIISSGEEHFDLVVSLEVIEHVEDYAGFLKMCTELAPKAILSSPNRARNVSSNHAGPPSYYQHVREWTAGEFYWVLKSFYRSVDLYVLPDTYVPQGVPCDVLETRSPLIASCGN